MSPVIRHSKGQHLKIFENAKSNGFARVRVDGKIFSLEENFNLDKNKWHNIEIVIDRLIKNKDLDKKRVSESVETALKIGSGVLYVDKQDEEEKVYSEHLYEDNTSTIQSTILARRLVGILCLKSELQGVVSF